MTGQSHPFLISSDVLLGIYCIKLNAFAKQVFLLKCTFIHSLERDHYCLLSK